MSDTFLDAPPHIYQPLEDAAQQVRLIHVRRNSDSSIECRLKRFPIHKLPRYQALSYTWGAPEPSHKIIIDQNGHLDVRENLYHFLEELCKAPQDYIWIDQISINQQDLSERNQQVSLMGRIFKQAAHVIIWLGGHNPLYTAAALTFNAHTSSATDRADALAILMHDKYFSRLWIVQEVLLATDLRLMVHANTWIPWSAICGFTWIDALVHRNVPQSALSLLELSTNETIKHDFAFYLVNFAGNQCAHPLDRVYGLLGLVERQLLIVPDYSKSENEVFGDVVLALCRGYVDGRLEESRPFAYAMWVLGESLGVEGVRPWRLRAFYEGLVRAKRRRGERAWGIEVGVEVVEGKDGSRDGERGRQGADQRWWLEVDGKRSWY